MAKPQEQLTELLSAYLDGEVTPREKTEVEEILRRDAGARRLLDELQQTSAMIAGLPRHGAPPDLAANLDAQLERVQLLSGLGETRGSATNSAPSRFSWLKAAAMLTLVVGGGWWFLALQQSKSTLHATKEVLTPELDEVRLGVNTPTPPRPVEDLLASGANPSVLLTNSFEVEPLRVQVVARNESDRDEIKRKLSSQFAQANAENLASRKAGADADNPLGAFYLEGKPGINFDDVSERQILVRLPQSRADQLIDSVTAGGKVADDQIALQVGSAVVQGPDKARAMLQMMASKDERSATMAPESSPRPETRSARGAEFGERGKPEGLLKTLSEIVGVTPATGERPREAASAADATSSRESETSDSARSANEGGKQEVASEDPTRPLVSRRLEVARSRAGAEESAPAEALTNGASPVSPMTRASTSAAKEPYITIVIELGVAQPKPSSRNGGPRSRS